MSKNVEIDARREAARSLASTATKYRVEGAAGRDVLALRISGTGH